MKQDKALAMIGLAQKAGKIVRGEFATEKAVKTGKAALVIVAGDASENTKKMFTNMENIAVIMSSGHLGCKRLTAYGRTNPFYFVRSQ